MSTTILPRLISCDEAGFTGNRMLDSAQPFFAYTSQPFTEGPNSVGVWQSPPSIGGSGENPTSAGAFDLLETPAPLENRPSDYTATWATLEASIAACTSA